MLTEIVVKFWSDGQLMGVDVRNELLSRDDLIDVALTTSENSDSNVVYHQDKSEALDQPMLTVIESRNPYRVTFITSLNISVVLSRIESYVNIARNAMFGKNW